MRPALAAFFIVAALNPVTIAQQPETAYASLMVESALKRTPVDFVLSLDQIADLLRKLGGDGK